MNRYNNSLFSNCSEKHHLKWLLWKSVLKNKLKFYCKFFIILIDSLSQPCDFFEFWLFIIDRISFSFIFNGKSRLFALMVRGGKVLVFDNRTFCCKRLIKKFGIYKKFEIISSFTNRGVIEGISLLLKKWFNIFQYALGPVSGLLGVLLNSFICFWLTAKMISVYQLDLVNAFSKSVFFYLLIMLFY